MNKIQFITAERARNLACNILSTKYKFFRISGHAHSSRYFGFKGTAYKIRVSDHKAHEANNDVKAEIIIDFDTLEADVEFRVKQAVYIFESRLRNKVMK